MSDDISSSVEGLLKSFGVASTKSRTSVESVLTDELQQRSHQAEMVSLRHGVLVLEASRTGVEFLRYDVDAILASIQEKAPGVVDSIQLRVARRG